MLPTKWQTNRNKSRWYNDMDDKTLLRPLFRQKALHVKQIKTNSIPQYAVGGIMYGLGQLVGRAGPWAARAWRGAKAGDH